jgi:hypothetical protein
MKRLVSIFVIALLFLSVGFVFRGGIVSVDALPVYQGNLILNGNNVTTIENKQFDINGSIIITENATLILRNAVLNFTQVSGGQFNMTLTNAVGGFPRLIVDNATITSNYSFGVEVDSSSLVNATRLTTAQNIDFDLYSSASAFVSNSMVGATGDSWSLQQTASLTASNSSFYNVGSWDVTTVTLTNCTIQTLYAMSSTSSSATYCTVDRASITVWGANFSVAGLNPGFFGYWNFKLNNTVSVVGQSPNFTLVNTQVNSWSFETRGTSNGTIARSQLYTFYIRETAVCCLNDSSTAYLYAYSSSAVWLVNSTAPVSYVYSQARVYYCWYLDVHVVDSMGQNVPSASVTAAFVNSTVVGSMMTDSGGMARFTLIEKMKNATGTYSVGDYLVVTTYSTYANGTSVGMLGNQQVTLVLSGLIVPEFPAPLLILPLFAIAASLIVLSHRRKRLEQR